MSLIINFVPTFTVSASMINALFTVDKQQGKLASSPLVTWSPRFYPSYPGSIPGQGLRSHHHSSVASLISETTGIHVIKFYFSPENLFYHRGVSAKKLEGETKNDFFLPVLQAEISVLFLHIKKILHLSQSSFYHSDLLSQFISQSFENSVHVQIEQSLA